MICSCCRMDTGNQGHATIHECLDALMMTTAHLRKALEARGARGSGSHGGASSPARTPTIDPRDALAHFPPEPVVTAAVDATPPVVVKPARLTAARDILRRLLVLVPLLALVYVGVAGNYFLFNYVLPRLVETWRP
jgi:hypothetical protein